MSHLPAFLRGDKPASTAVSIANAATSKLRAIVKAPARVIGITPYRGCFERGIGRLLFSVQERAAFTRR